MQKIEALFSQDLYEKHLSTLNNIHFTKREIDIMACLLSGRRTSKIAYFLSINPRTAETHIRNVMVKLECNTRESIIDFIEATDKVYYLRRYYSLLQLEALFKKSLNDISKLIREKSPRCFLKFMEDKEPLGIHLKSHLTLAGITVLSSAKKKDGDYLIIIGPQTLTGEEIFPRGVNANPSKVIFLLQAQKSYKELPKWLANVDVIDCGKHENYYFSFFTLLQKLLPDIKLDEIVSHFKDKYKKIPVELTSSQSPSNKGSRKILFALQLSLNYPLYFAAFIIVLLSFTGFLTLQWYQNSKKQDSLRSDLAIPKESAFLNRSELLTQIYDKFKKQSGIQTVALVGPGGAGKTTLARQYAHSQNQPIVWEINAETSENLKSSFESLAQVLAKTEEDQKTLKGIQNINESLRKEDQIIQFVKEGLKSKSGWFLIFDNVNKFTDIQKYFPSDSDTWGQGKIILTTRDANIGSNEHVNHTIFIGELNPHQKLSLFIKVMGNEGQGCFTKAQDKELELFLEKLPPFPLDITIAAYYLKATGVPYASYLRKLSQSEKDFVNMQASLLKEAGYYVKTRYSIISTSLQKIMEAHQDFKDLLLLICLVDSQNISRAFLANFKSEEVVDNFIFNLKKYSFLTNEFKDFVQTDSLLFIHRSTQAIGLFYLTEKLGLRQNKESMNFISDKLVSYLDKAIEKEDLNKMRSLISHCEWLLTHKELLTPRIEGVIKGELGIIYYFHGESEKAKALFEESLAKSNNSYQKDPTRVAMLMGYLGNTLKELGNYAQSRDILEKSLSIYENYYPKNNLKHAYFAVYLGIVERILGNYEVAKKLFERGLNINKTHFPQNENYKEWVSGQLGILDREQGNYEKAKNKLEASLASFKKERGLIHFDNAWALEHLGIVYIELGDYEKAKNALEESLKIYASLVPDQIGSSWTLAQCAPFSTQNEQNIKSLFAQLNEIYRTRFQDWYVYTAFPMRSLGNLYAKLGNYEKAKILLEQVLVIYEKNYGSNHIEVARALNDLGEVYCLSDDLKTSEEFLSRAIRIFEHYKHPEHYICLEHLSNLFMKKSMLAVGGGMMKESQDFKARATSYLNQALEIVKTHFSKDSPHIPKIRAKLESLE